LRPHEASAPVNQKPQSVNCNVRLPVRLPTFEPADKIAGPKNQHMKKLTAIETGTIIAGGPGIVLQ
jgi:hypothetical protein